MLASVAVVAVVAAGAALGVPRYLDRCAASYPEVDDPGELRLRWQQPGNTDLPAGNGSDPDARQTLAAARQDPASLGTLTKVAVLPESLGGDPGAGSLTTVGARPDSVQVAVSGAALPGWEVSGALASVSLESGRARWARQFGGHGAGGGVIDGSLVSAQLPEDEAARIAAVDVADGSLRWCTKIGDDMETEWDPAFDLAVDPAGNGSVLLPSPPDSNRFPMHNIDLATGAVRWERAHEIRVGSPELHSFGALAVLSPSTANRPVAHSNAQTDEYSYRTIGLTAVSAENGDASWHYVRGKDWTSALVGASDDVGVAVDRRVHLTRTGDEYEEKQHASLTGLDPAGKVRWRTSVPALFGAKDDIAIVDDLVLTKEPDGTKGRNQRYRVVARDVTSGQVRWRSAPAQNPPSLDSLRTDGSIAMPRYGTRAIDLVTGRLIQPLAGHNWRHVYLSSTRNVVVAEGLLLVFEPSGS